LTLATLVTLLRIAIIPFIIYLLFFNAFAAGILFILSALTDWLDGFIARRLKQTSVLGAFLDPLADKILILSVLIVLVELGKVSSLPVIIILARELAIMGIRVVAAHRNISLPVEKIAKLKTVVQMIAVTALIFNLPYGSALLWAAVALSLISGVKYLWVLKK